MRPIKREGFVFYKSFFDSIDNLPVKNRLPIYEAIMHYIFNAKIEDLKGVELSVFTLIRPQLDANNKKFLVGKKGGIKGKQFGKLGGKYGILGGRPANPPKNPPKTPPNVNVNVNVKEQQAIDELLRLLGDKVFVKNQRLFSKTKTGNKIINDPVAYLSSLKENRQTEQRAGESVMDEYIRRLK